MSASSSGRRGRCGGSGHGTVSDHCTGAHGAHIHPHRRDPLVRAPGPPRAGPAAPAPATTRPTAWPTRATSGPPPPRVVRAGQRRRASAPASIVVGRVEAGDRRRSAVRWANGARVPLVPFGAGSGVCGGVLPREDVVVVDLKRMARLRSARRGAPRPRRRGGAHGRAARGGARARRASRSGTSPRRSSAAPSAGGSRRAAPGSARATTARSRTWSSRSSA